MTQPSDFPEFDTTETDTTDPGAARKLSGWVVTDGVPEKPSFRIFNFWMNLVYKWIYYLFYLVKPVSSIAELRAISFTPSDGDTISVTGYYTKGDGGGGQFYFDATSTEIDDNGLIIKPSSIATGRFKRFIENNTYKPAMFGIFGDSDGTTGDGTEWSAQLRAMFISIPSNSIIDFPKNKIFRTTSGVDVTKDYIRINGNKSILYLDGVSTRSLTIPTFADGGGYDASLIVWNGSESQNIVLLDGGATGKLVNGDMAVVPGAEIYGFECYDLGFKGNDPGVYQGSAATSFTLLGAINPIVKGCFFLDNGGVTLHCRVVDMVATGNVFENTLSDSIAGLFGGVTTLDYNKFTNCLYGLEVSINYGTASHNIFENTTKTLTSGVWVNTSGVYESNVDVRVESNHFNGPHSGGIFINDSTVGGSPASFKRVVIQNNTFEKKGGAGNHRIYCDTFSGSTVIQGNSMTDTGETVNSEAFIFITGVDTSGTYIIKDNTAVISTGFVLNMVQIPGIDLDTTVEGNVTKFKGTGAYRDTSDTVYKAAIRSGNFNPNFIQVLNNHIGDKGKNNTSTGTNLVVWDDNYISLNPSTARSISTIRATGFFTLYNNSSSFNITIVHAVGVIETLLGVDLILSPGQCAGFISSGQSGVSYLVKQVF